MNEQYKDTTDELDNDEFGNDDSQGDDRPQTIAVLGAGPVGLETALYGRFLGYEVTVFEKGQVCDHVRQWSHVKLFTSFAMNHSRLGLAAIEAQYPDFKFLDLNASHTGEEWLKHYLLPLAQTDLLEGNIRENCRVISVGRFNQSRQLNVGNSRRGQSQFRVHIDDNGTGKFEEFDFVIDASGTFGQPKYMGTGGLPAIGELELRASDPKQQSQICYSIPQLNVDDVRNKHVMIVGRGYSAATNIVRLAELNEQGANCQVTWATEKQGLDQPIKRIENDALPLRDELAKKANLIANESANVRWVDATVYSARQSDDRATFCVTLEGKQPSEFQCDLIFANVGFKGDFEIISELQVHRCYATDGPIKWAASLLAQSGADCMTQVSNSAETLLTTEPGFFVLGSKLYGRDNRFLFSLGLRQIRDAYRLITGREKQDLFSTIQLSSTSKLARS